MKRISNSTTTPAPVGGLNTFDVISAMPPNDALVLRNFFPSSYGLNIRKGYRKFAWGLVGIVKTVMSWRGTSGTNTMFAIDDDGIHDISLGGEVSLTPVVLLTDSEVQYINFGNAAGVHLIGFNGTDDGVWYDGTTWKRLVAAIAPATPVEGEWGGVDPKKLIHVTAHQKRIWAVEENSMLGWYLPPEQVWGVAKSFDFGGVFNRGGYLQALTTWTHDGGDGMDDYLIAITSAGQIAVYKGLSPDSADTWSLVGVYFVGATFSRRCFAKYGGDVVFITQYGALSMSGILRSQDGSVLTTALSRKVQSLFSELTTEGSYRSGWQIVVYPAANLMMVNIPGLQLNQNLQVALNTITSAWTIFDGMDAYCWATDYDSLFFGGDGLVYLAWNGFSDDAEADGTGGDDIIATVQQAFNYFDSPGTLKHYKMVRPTFLTSGNFDYNIGINIDFRFNNVETPGSVGISSVGIWDHSTWSTEYLWSGGFKDNKYWSSVVDFGFAASVRMTVRSHVELVWTSTDFLYEKGGVI
jgi:hypothetical protein